MGLVDDVGVDDSWSNPQIERRFCSSVRLYQAFSRLHCLRTSKNSSRSAESWIHR